MINPIDYLFSIICHRDPLRSFAYDGNVYLCARCTGIYIGGLFGYILLKYSPLKINLRDVSQYGLVIVLSLLIFPSVVDKLFIQNHNISLLIKNVIFINGMLIGYSISIVFIYLTHNRRRCDYVMKFKLIIVRLILCLLLISITSLLIVPRNVICAIITPLLGVLLILYIVNYNILFSLFDRYNLQVNSKLIKIVSLLLIILMSIIELIIIVRIKQT